MSEQQQSGSQALVVLAATRAALFVGGYIVRKLTGPRLAASPPTRPAVAEGSANARRSQAPAARVVDSGQVSGGQRTPRGSWREENPWLARQAHEEAALSDADWLRQHEAMEHGALRGDHGSR